MSPLAENYTQMGAWEVRHLRAIKVGSGFWVFCFFLALCVGGRIKVSSPCGAYFTSIPPVTTIPILHIQVTKSATWQIAGYLPQNWTDSLQTFHTDCSQSFSHGRFHDFTFKATETLSTISGSRGQTTAHKTLSGTCQQYVFNPVILAPNHFPLIFFTISNTWGVQLLNTVSFTLFLQSILQFQSGNNKPMKIIFHYIICKGLRCEIGKRKQSRACQPSLLYRRSPHGCKSAEQTVQLHSSEMGDLLICSWGRWLAFRSYCS